MLNSIFKKILGNTDSKTEQNRILPIKRRQLHLESLESREMLSISPLEFDAIRSLYADLNLSVNMADYNIIEITAAELSAASLQAAINIAGQTPQDDLVVVRTHDQENQIDLDVPLTIDIDASLFGSITIVSFNNTGHLLPLNINQTSGTALSITQGNVALAGMTFFGDEAALGSSIDLPAILSVSEQVTLTTSTVGFFQQGERLTYTENYGDGSSQTFALSETANLGFWTPYTWTDAVVLSSQESFFLGDNLFQTDQDIHLDFAVSNLGDQGIDRFSAEVWVNGHLATTLDSLSLDAWQLGGIANIPLGSFAVGTHTVEVVLLSSDPGQNPVQHTTSFTVTGQVQQLSGPQNVRYDWDANFAGYLLRWDAVAGATRYVVEVIDAAGTVSREYHIATVAYMGKHHLLEAGCRIQVTAQNAVTDSVTFVFEPIEANYARGSWSDPVDPYNITDVIKTSGPVQVAMNTSGYTTVTGLNYIAVPDPVYIDLIRQACAQWEAIITQGLPVDNRFGYLGPIDDLRIDFGFVDYGASNILGSSYSGANRTTGNGGLPVTSTIIYNTQYFKANPNQTLQDYFYGVVLHEIGHSLGYRMSLMQTFGLVATTTTKPLAAMSTVSGYSTYYYYTGTNGVREFNNTFGTGMPFSGSNDRFLMETVASSGSFGSHISAVYGTYYQGYDIGQTELMNWQAYQSGMTLSTINIGVLEDLGYSVDYAMADPFGSYTPVNLTVTSNSSIGVSLAWDMPKGTVSQYEVYRRVAATNADNPWTLIGTTTSKNYTDTTIAGNQQYEYHVVAVNTSNVSQDVGAFSANPGSTLSWTPVPGASSYMIYRLNVSSSDNQLSWTRLTATTTSTSYNIGNTISYTTYFHIVANGLTQARSQPSRAVRVETDSIIIAPVAPVNFQSTAQTANSVTLSWNSQSSLTGYTLQYKTSTSSVWQTWTPAPGASATSETITGLTANTAYDFLLTATNAGGSATSTTSATTDKIKLGTPMLGTVTATSSSVINVNWSIVANADGYVVQYATNSAFTTGVGTVTVNSQSTTSTNISGLNANTMYYVRIMAAGTGSYSNSDYSTVKSVTTDKINLSTPSTPVAVVTGTSTIDVSWKPVPNASGYVVEYAPGQFTNQQSITVLGTSTTLTGLPSNSYYNIRVIALGDGITYANSEPSAHRYARTYAESPLNFQTTGQTTDSITLAWNTPTGGAFFYQLEYSLNGTDWYLVADNISTTSYTHTGLDAGTTYYYRVSGGNGTGYGIPTSLLEISTSPLGTLVADSLTIDVSYLRRKPISKPVTV